MGTGGDGLKVQFFGATGEVTGSLYVIRAGNHTVLLECGLVQGSRKSEERNRNPFPFPVDDIDAVVVSHAHIDHSGRLPLLMKRGYLGPIYAQKGTAALCRVMLPDSGYLNENEAKHENRKRRQNRQASVDPLYTREDAEACLRQFKSINYEQNVEIVPGLSLRFHDAGHILGSSIVELRHTEHGGTKTVVFSGDLGPHDSPVMDKPAQIAHADAVIMESTYGDRVHRSMQETLVEMEGVLKDANKAGGNVLIPAFTVGRTQDLLYLMMQNYDKWALHQWKIFLDSPMAIQATKTYAEYRRLFGAQLFRRGESLPSLPGLHATKSTEESMSINEIESGAIIIAGSGMCSGGRILHHLKHNIWRPECHVIIVGFQADGTLGRRLVDGASEVRLSGDAYNVRAQVHTIGGFSAHADQTDLCNWYGGFRGKPDLYLVHGEKRVQEVLSRKLRIDLKAAVHIAKYGQTINV